MGATLFNLEPPQGTYSAVHLIEALHRFPVTNLCCPPTIYRSLLTTEARTFYRTHKFKALEHAVSAGEPINGPVISAFRDLTGVTICDGWGQVRLLLNIIGTPASALVRERFRSDRLDPRHDADLSRPRRALTCARCAN